MEADMLTLETGSSKTLTEDAAPVALFCGEGAAVSGGGWLPARTRRSLAARLQDEGFKGKEGETASFLLHVGDGVRRFFIAGLGSKKARDGERLRRAAGALYAAAKDRCETLWVVPPGEPGPAAEGLLLAGYVFSEYKQAGDGPRLKAVRFPFERAAARKRTEKILGRAALFAEGVCFARDLVNRGPSDKSPSAMAAVAKAMAGAGVSVKVIDKRAAEKLGMGGLLGVSRGAAQPPCLVHFKYKPRGRARKRVGLVGKGITFDSGGLSLKPAASMDTMKCDMAGAAAVFGTFQVLARMDLRVEVHGFVPLAFNMPGPDAIKPGDILRVMNGKTIEVLNTDAEGRLVLADALTYAVREKMDAIIDAATLTGACVIALGSDITGAMSNDRGLLSRLLSASRRTGEPVWELPLFDPYRGDIKSPIADLKNTGKPREAGAVIAGIFLEEFVEDTPWVHLDIAGPAFSAAAGPCCPAGGTGVLVRTFLDFLESY